MKSAEQLIDDLTAHFLSGYPYVYLLTWEEERADALLMEAAKQADKKVIAWSTTVEFSPKERAATAPEKIVFERLSLAANADEPTVFVLRDIHPYLEDPLIARLLRDLVRKNNQKGHVFVFISPKLVVPQELEKDIAIIDLPLPGQEQLEEVFRKIQVEQKALFPEEFVTRVVQAAMGLTQREAERIFRRALLKGGGFKLDDVKLVIEEKRRMLRQSELLEFYEAGESLAAVGGLSELKKWLKSRESAFGENAKKYGLPSPKGMMMIGVQGCGKSLTAKAVADLWKFPLLRFDIGSAFNIWGQGEEYLRRAIKISESLSPVVLWIDEIEKGFAGVTSGETDRDISRAFGTFITWLQEKTEPVFVVATANEVRGLPPELMRKGRFDEIFFVDLPDIHEREDIFRIHITRRGRNPEGFNIGALGALTDHYSGSEIEQIVISALYRAFSEERELLQSDLEISVKETVPLYSTYEEKIKELRDWAKNRARFASRDVTLLDYFGEGPKKAKAGT